ncbi:hypothetical protein HAX54_001669 [Datura stramonium]|uniref:Uncharacterized protein n=1 Tax=Datura stramonium TaxID=4076 RepID=A0ABS8WTH1_DATST|nr:hypothetical protein [Datura stramonium]
MCDAAFVLCDGACAAALLQRIGRSAATLDAAEAWGDAARRFPIPKMVPRGSSRTCKTVMVSDKVELVACEDL